MLNLRAVVVPVLCLVVGVSAGCGRGTSSVTGDRSERPAHRDG
jgi:hypothetical protein